MKFKRDYSYGTHEVKGYEFDGGYICKDERFVGICNTVVDGWEVLSFVNPYRTVRIYYAGTLKEAKEWVEKNWKEEK